MLKMKDQFKEAATVYFRICSEVLPTVYEIKNERGWIYFLPRIFFLQELLHSAVMLEQASYCYLLSQPPMLHKYGFHLVLSGDRYKKCDQVLILFTHNLIIANCMMRLLKIFAASSCRLNMQFVHIKTLSQYIREPHGATSKIMFISISASK
jgi:hypothetical protein